jgi:hypothetical protein
MRFTSASPGSQIVRIVAGGTANKRGRISAAIGRASSCSAVVLATVSPHFFGTRIAQRLHRASINCESCKISMQVSIIIPPTSFNRQIGLIRAWLDQSAPQSWSMTLEGTRLTVIFSDADLARAYVDRWCDGYAVISPQLRFARHQPSGHPAPVADPGNFAFADDRVELRPDPAGKFDP